MVIVFYISGHGFGHATRDLEIIRHLQQQRPGTRIIVRTSVPAWFLENDQARASIDVQPCETDYRIVQIDSLRLDEAETCVRRPIFTGQFDGRVDAEADILKKASASIVVGDVPPLAFAAAARAAIPSIAVANFTWDWIYAAMIGFTKRLQPCSRRFETHTRTRIWRCGFHSPAVSRRCRRSAMCRSWRDIHVGPRDGNRRLLDVSNHRPVVLASFGGHGANLPFERVAEDPEDVTLIVTDYEATVDARQRSLRRPSSMLHQPGTRAG